MKRSTSRTLCACGRTKRITAKTCGQCCTPIAAKNKPAKDHRQTEAVDELYSACASLVESEHRFQAAVLAYFQPGRQVAWQHGGHARIGEVTHVSVWGGSGRLFVRTSQMSRLQRVCVHRVIAYMKDH